MKQFITPVMPDETGRIRLSGRDYHYLAGVRRLNVGDSCPLLLPSGERAEARVEARENKTLILMVETFAKTPPDTMPSVTLTLFQALPRGTKMDIIARQATECGTAKIVPFIAERSVPRPRQAESPAQTARWNRIAREARQQSGSPVATEVSAPVSWNALFEIWDELRQRDTKGTLGIMLDSSPLAQGALHEYLKEQVTQVALAIGPEGGFSPPETETFFARGFKPLSLGKTVLRIETAALCALASVRIVLLEKQSWIHIANV